MQICSLDGAKRNPGWLHATAVLFPMQSRRERKGKNHPVISTNGGNLLISAMSSEDLSLSVEMTDWFLISPVSP
jgi:hypothetical protein